MEFIKLNTNWNADPNSPRPCIKIKNSSLFLSFYLNCFAFEGFCNDDIGVLEFHSCVQFRMGSLNDEDFYRYGDQYKEKGIEWGEFYRIVELDGNVALDNPIYIESAYNAEKLNHYLFYFRDEDFECIAAGFKFSICKERP